MKKRLFSIIKNRKFVLLVFALVLLFIFFIKPRFFDKVSRDEKTTVKIGDIQAELTLSGSIEADERVTLQFQTGGLLSFVGVREGDYVQKGKLIASLDSRQLQKTLSKYLNTYVKERDDFDQTKFNNKDTVLTDTVKRAVEQAQADVDNSVLDVEIQNISLQYAHIYTPIEGLVTNVDSPLPGVNVTAINPSTFEIVNPKTIYFDVSADQTEITDIEEGMKGKITFDTYPDEVVDGIIQTISFSPKTDESGTVYTVKVNILANNTNYKYRLGMTGDISFITDEEKNVLYLPASFVKSDGEKKYVLKGDKKEKVFVTIGLETDTDAEIKSGLVEGDIIYE